MSVRDIFEDGTMRYMLEKKLITPTVFRYVEISATVSFYQTQGHNKTQSVKITSDNCRVCEDTVWKALRATKDH